MRERESTNTAALAPAPAQAAAPPVPRGREGRPASEGPGPASPRTPGRWVGLPGCESPLLPHPTPRGLPRAPAGGWACARGGLQALPPPSRGARVGTGRGPGDWGALEGSLVCRPRGAVPMAWGPEQDPVKMCFRRSVVPRVGKSCFSFSSRLGFGPLPPWRAGGCVPRRFCGEASG